MAEQIIRTRWRALPLAAPVDEAGSERAMRRLAVPVLAAFAALAVYAAASLRALYGDGCAYLMQMMQTQDFAFIEPSRRTVHFLQEFPAVLAMRLRIEDTETLTMLFGLGMHLVPLILVGLCYFLLPVGKKAYFAFPLFHYLAGTQAAALHGIAEAPVASAYFWFLLCLLMRVPRASAFLLLAIVPAVVLHEALFLLAPVLALAAYLRLRDSDDYGDRIIWWMLVLWSLLIAVVQAGYILWPRDPGNRYDFLLTMLTFDFLFEVDGINFGGDGLNVCVVIGLLAAAAVLLLWRAERHGEGAAARRRIILGFAVLAAALVIASAFVPLLMAPAMQSEARSYGALMSLPLALLFLLSWREASWRGLWLRPTTMSVLGVLAAAQLGWQVLATATWSQYLGDFRTLLASREGFIRWPEAMASLPPERAYRVLRFSGFWTNPTLSLLLAPNGEVRAILDNPVAVRWQPFDPADPRTLPPDPRYHYEAYRAALARAAAAPR